MTKLERTGLTDWEINALTAWVAEVTDPTAAYYRQQGLKAAEGVALFATQYGVPVDTSPYDIPECLRGFITASLFNRFRTPNVMGDCATTARERRVAATAEWYRLCWQLLADMPQTDAWDVLAIFANNPRFQDSMRVQRKLSMKVLAALQPTGVRVEKGRVLVAAAKYRLRTEYPHLGDKIKRIDFRAELLIVIRDEDQARRLLQHELLHAMQAARACAMAILDCGTFAGLDFAD